jgi:MYXO-CTERM domain-containing protein
VRELLAVGSAVPRPMVGAALDIGAFERGSGPPVMRPDSGMPDAGGGDGGGPTPDGSLPDGGGSDGGGADGGGADGGASGEADGGCGCRMAAPADGTSFLAALLVVAVLLERRRRGA